MKNPADLRRFNLRHGFWVQEYIWFSFVHIWYNKLLPDQPRRGPKPEYFRYGIIYFYEPNFVETELIPFLLFWYWGGFNDQEDN